MLVRHSVHLELALLCARASFFILCEQVEGRSSLFAGFYHLDEKEQAFLVDELLSERVVDGQLGEFAQRVASVRRRSRLKLRKNLLRRLRLKLRGFSYFVGLALKIPNQKQIYHEGPTASSK